MPHRGAGAAIAISGVRCGHQAVSYNSCRITALPESARENARAKWLAARSAELLPVPYFPISSSRCRMKLSALALGNKRFALRSALPLKAPQRMLELARNPKHLGADIGGSWCAPIPGDRNLQHHPHVHYIVSRWRPWLPTAPRWIDSSRRFFLPVHALSPRLPRQVSVAELKQLARSEQASVSMARNSIWATPRDASPTFLRQLFPAGLGRLRQATFSAAPNTFSTTLARYTQSAVAISNHRLVAFENDRRLLPLARLCPWRQAEDHEPFSADEFLRQDFFFTFLPQRPGPHPPTSASLPTEAGKAPSHAAASCSALLACPDRPETTNLLRCPRLLRPPCWSSNGSPALNFTFRPDPKPPYPTEVQRLTAHKNSYRFTTALPLSPMACSRMQTPSCAHKLSKHPSLQHSLTPLQDSVLLSLAGFHRLTLGQFCLRIGPDQASRHHRKSIG